MLKLEATLVATQAAKPWRCGWPLDRGIDFIVRGTSPPVLLAPTPDVSRIAAAEPGSFLDPDDALRSAPRIVRLDLGDPAQTGDSAVDNRCDRALTRAWSSVARKLPSS